MALSCCKKLSALLRGIASNHYGDFYCINCLHSFRTENKLKKHKNVCKNHDCCYIEMPKKYNKVLKYIHGQKCLKFQFIVYADLESLLNKINTCHNNPKKSSTTKINKHTPSGYSLFTHYFCKDLEHIMKIINYDKKEMIPLTIKENRSYHEQKVVIYAKKNSMLKIKSEIIVILLENIEELIIMFAV